MPDQVYKGCEPFAHTALATLILQLKYCKTSGGHWVVSQPAQGRYPGTCSCLSKTQICDVGTEDGHGETSTCVAKNMPRLYIENRGCLAEADFCKESGGEWIEGPFPVDQSLLQLSKCRQLPKFRWEPQPHRGGPCLVQYKSWPTPQARFCHDFEVSGLQEKGVLKQYSPSSEPYHNCWYESQNSKRTFPTSFCRIDGQRAEWISLGVGFRQ